MMPYILVADIKGLTYYVQRYKGELRLNGLQDNAVIWEDIGDARIASYTYSVKLQTELTVRAIPPYPQSNT